MSEQSNPNEESPHRGETPAGEPDAPTQRRRSVLGSILRTSKETSTHVTSSEASMAARKCRNCGGARPEGSDLRFCGFCGDRFMTDEAGSGVDPDAPAPEG